MQPASTTADKPRTQAEKIIRHIELNGSITQREALLDYGVQSFTRRLVDIERMGRKLLKIRKKHPVTGQRYTRVYLEDVNTFPDLSEKQPVGNQAHIERTPPTDEHLSLFA